LGEVQTARTDLARAISDRSDLPRRFVEDNKKIAILKSATSTLEAFTGQLSFIVTNEVGGSLPDISYRKGDLPLPAQGRIIRKFNETDAAGIVRPGIVVATAPEALVTTPTAATIRYNGEFFEYGLVTILEPQAGMLFVFAGMNVVFGKIGEVLPAGSPVGLMGGTAIQGAEDSLSSSSISSDLQQTLYIEVRENTSAIDPLGWFKE
jgi:septal ring factor EnvC (AmiA/AmiB activator)